MRLPHASTLRRRPPLSLALSLAVHVLGLALVWCFAPSLAPTVVDEAPVALRVSLAVAEPAPQFVPPRATDRRTPLAESEFAPVPMEIEDQEQLLGAWAEDAAPRADEPPSQARRGAIGAGDSGLQRLPHPPAGRAPLAALMQSGPAQGAEPAASALSIGAEDSVLVLPEALDCPAPEYPAPAASVHECGRVRIEISIDRQGRVSDVRVLKSSGYARLDEAACQGVRRWRFHPARRAGEALPWKLEHTISFRMLGVQP